MEKDLTSWLPPRYDIPVLNYTGSSRVERVDGIKRTVVFDILSYWQAFVTFQCLLRAILTLNLTKHLSVEFYPLQGVLVCAVCNSSHR